MLPLGSSILGLQLSEDLPGVPLRCHESFRVISVTIPLVTLTAGLRGFLEASGRFPFLSLVTAFTGVGMYVLPVVVVMAGGGLVWIATAYVLVRIGLAVAFAIGCLRVKGRPSLRPALSSKAVKSMVSFGGWLSVSNVVGTAMVYGDRFLLGSCVGMVAVTSYSMPLDVIGRMQIIITSFCAVLFPLMSRLDGSGSAHFQTVYRGAVAIVLSLLTPMIVGMILLSPLLMKIWLRARNTPDAVFSAEVFLAGSIVQAMASISFTALHARGRSDLTAWVHMAEFPIYCVVFTGQRPGLAYGAHRSYGWAAPSWTLSAWGCLSRYKNGAERFSSRKWPPRLCRLVFY